MNDEDSPPDAGGDADAGGAGQADAAASPLSPPGLGMVGGGYRTRLTAQAAISLGIGFRVLAEAPDDSAAQVAPSAGTVIGDYRSADDLLAFAAGCEIVTVKPEDVPADLLAKLEAQVAVRPSPATLRLVRDKAALGEWLNSLGAAADLSGLRSAADRELAVIAARSPEGQGVTYPVTLMVRRDGQRREGQRREFIAPAPGLDPALTVEAQRLALKIAAELTLTGLLTVELAESGGKLTITDLAVTPHDSGLWTIDAAVTSQFEQNLRAVLDLPFGTPGALAAHAVTVTVAGGDDPDVFTRFVHVMAADPGARVHIYTNQVSQIGPGRRVGHVTVAGDDLEGLRDRAWRAANYLGLGTEDPSEDQRPTS